MKNHVKTSRHSLPIVKKNERCSSSLNGQEQDHTQMKMNNLANGQTITSSVKDESRTKYTSCLRHRPDGIYFEKHHCQPDTSAANRENDRSSTNGHTPGRVSFAYVPISEALVVRQSTTETQSNCDPTEKIRRSALFVKKAKELRLAESTYFKDHAQDLASIDD